jgi:hypothetical protein
MEKAEEFIEPIEAGSDAAHGSLSDTNAPPAGAGPEGAGIGRP